MSCIHCNKHENTPPIPKIIDKIENVIIIIYYINHIKIPLLMFPKEAIAVQEPVYDMYDVYDENDSWQKTYGRFFNPSFPDEDGLWIWEGTQYEYDIDDIIEYKGNYRKLTIEELNAFNNGKFEEYINQK